MDAGHFAYVHQVQAGIHVGGKFAVQEIDNDSTRRSGLDVLLAHRRRGIEKNHISASASCFQNSLFRNKL